jgi:hypothetical protein
MSPIVGVSEASIRQAEVTNRTGPDRRGLGKMLQLLPQRIRMEGGPSQLCHRAFRWRCSGRFRDYGYGYGYGHGHGHGGISVLGIILDYRRRPASRGAALDST